MDITNINENVSKTVGKNVKDLKEQAGLTIDGLTFALSISISYTLMIERGAANISTKLAKEIANFFAIEISKLYSEKPIKLKDPLKIPTIAKFYKENEKNAKFFTQRRAEYSVAAFLRNVLLYDPFMKDGRTVSDIIKYSDTQYQRNLESQEVSRELRRLYLKDVLERKDKFENGSVYLYSLKK
jgi:transcriptional regulator with XRE-family HTH domain